MSFAQPGWLALLLLIPLLGIAGLLASRFRKRQWDAFVAPRLRHALLKRGGSMPRWLALTLLLISCAALIIGLARPQGDAGVKTEKNLSRNVLIALDLSRSMRVADVKPDRLSQAKVVIYELLEAMPNERVGLIGFAGSSYLYAPLTIDHSAVRETVEQIDENWATLGGSDLASAIHLATDTLKKTGQKNNALVILSDGEEHDGDLNAMISEAEKSGVYIIAVGVGTEDGGFVPNSDFPNGQMIDKTGRPVVSRLQPAVMRKLAEQTKGRYANAGSSLNIPELVGSVVKDLDAFEMKGRDRRISIEFYQWLLLPAIFFLMTSIIAATRWKGVRATLVALFIGAFTMQPSHASEATEAGDALKNQDYKKAGEAYHKLAETSSLSETRARYRLGEATAEYRNHQFREARAAYSKALLSNDSAVRAQAHEGLGNTLFQLGWQGLTDESYPADPDALPDLTRFDELVKERLAKLRETEAPDEGEANDFVRIEGLITNWADSVRHYHSALALTPGNPVATQNRELTMTYLKRLRELLKKEEEETSQAMPQPMEGQGEPKAGEGEDGEGEPKEGEGDGKDPKKDGGKGGDQEKKPGDQGKDPNGKKGDKPDSKDKGSKNGDNPNEGPEDRARRLLKENSDSEKGPLTPGRREFRPPEKDW